MVGQFRISAIRRFLEIGALSVAYPKLDRAALDRGNEVSLDKPMIYRPTPFGRAVLKTVMDELGL